MYINELGVYPLIFTLLLFILNYIYFNKNLTEANDLKRIKNYKLLRTKFTSIIILLFALMLDSSIYGFVANTNIESAEKEIPNQIINIFSYSQYITIVLKNIVVFILFKKIVENVELLEIDKKAISKYITFLIIAISIATLPIIFGVSFLFQEIGNLM